MIINSASLAMLRQGYSAAFNKQLAETKTYYQQIATVVPSATAMQTYGWLGQFPQMREWVGEREVANMAEEAYTVANKHFERTLGIPRDTIEDDTYGMYSVVFSSMGQAGAELPDDLVFGMLQDGFSKTCYDKKPFFAADHKSGKKTFSNRTDKKLSPEAYAEARAAMQTLTGDQGKPLGIIPSLLVVSAANEKVARKILKSDLIEGSSNVWKDSAEMLVAPKLAGHPDYWFLLDTTKFLKPMIYQERKKVQFVSMTRETDHDVFMRNEYLYGADGRGAAGFGYWQMAYGSTGEKA